MKPINSKKMSNILRNGGNLEQETGMCNLNIFKAFWEKIFQN